MTQITTESAMAAWASRPITGKAGVVLEGAEFYEPSKHPNHSIDAVKRSSHWKSTVRIVTVAGGDLVKPTINARCASHSHNI